MLDLKIKKIKLRNGFTLIELLIVIAVLGTLSTVVLLALNPIQQLAKARDAGRKSIITQLGHALEAYATAHNGVYVAEGSTWITTLQSAGEITAIPSAIVYSVTGISACTINAQNGLCYDASAMAGTAPVITFTRLESLSESSRCASGNPFFVYSTANGRGGLVCSATAPTPGVQTFID